MVRMSISIPRLKELLKVAMTVTDELRLVVSKDGVRTKVVDPASVALASMELSKEGFEEYQATECELGLDLDKLKEFVSLGKATDMLEMELDEEKNKLVLYLGNLTRRMGLISTESMTDPRIPELKLPAKVEVAAEELLRGIKASAHLTDRIDLKATPGGFELVGDGDIDRISLKLEKHALISHECESEVQSLFSLEYLQEALRSVPSTKPVTFMLGQDFPLRLEFKVAEGHCDVLYLIAPRVEKTD